jgi:hypothetical protein
MVIPPDDRAEGGKLADSYGLILQVQVTRVPYG